MANVAVLVQEGYLPRNFTRARAWEVASILVDAGLVDSLTCVTGEGDLTEAAKDPVENALAA